VGPVLAPLLHLRVSPLPTDLISAFERKFKTTIIEGYGLTEGTCASSVNPIDSARKPGSIGLPLKGQEIRIVDGRGFDMEDGEVGEMLIRGDNVMKGYYRNQEATAEVLRNGWLHTGDIGYRDGDGYFFLLGRTKEMIIRGGENIYPSEIEEVLYQDPRVQEVAVGGLPDKIWGEEVIAFIALKKGEAFPQEEVMEFCMKRLADYKCPRRVVYLKRLPKTSTGRIQKSRLLEDFMKRKSN